MKGKNHVQMAASCDIQDIRNGVSNQTDSTQQTHHDNRKRLIFKLKNSKTFQKKFLTAVSLLWGYFILGWSLAQLGPSFLDLQIITRTSLDEASKFFTFHSGGYLVGSLVTGLVYDKIVYDKSLVIALTLVGHTAVLTAIPWCTIYETMVLAHALKGVFSGGFETCGNAHIILVCGNKNAALLQALYFAFGAGGIISPYAIAPFLAEETNFPNSQRSTIVDIANTTSQSVWNVDTNTSAFWRNGSHMDFINGNATTPQVKESVLYIGYSISALLTLSSAIPFFILFFNSKCKKEATDKTQEKTKSYPKRSQATLAIILIIMSIIMGFYCGIEDSFNNFLATLCVKQLNWTKRDGATATSIYWTALSVGRLFGIFFVRHFKPSRLIIILFLLLSVSQGGFLVSAQFKYDVGIWIFISCFGLSGSVLFPLLFTWMEEDIIQMTGKITSILMIAASGGASINPIVIGFTMDNYSPMWLSYILTTEIVLCILLCLIILVNTYKARHIKELNVISEIHVNPGFQNNSLPDDSPQNHVQESNYISSVRL